MASHVIFRRIHGRIVPIKSETKHNVTEGSALVGAGLATGYAAGRHSGMLMHQAANLENSSRLAARVRSTKMAEAVKHGPLFVQRTIKETENLNFISHKNLEMSNKVRSAAFKVRHLGTVASAGLVAAGVHRATKGTELEKSPKTQAAIVTGSGIAAGFVAYSGFARKVGNRGFRVLKLAARRAFLKL